MKADTGRYYIDWLAMDQLGNQLFNAKRYQDALLIFENNTAEFPDRDYIYISLGRTYEKLNRKSDAINAYKKAIALNKNNEEARNRLKELEQP